jgi:multiple sugar transport system substrate-binding protein
VVRTKVQANQAPDILNIDAYSGFSQDDLLYPATDIASPETIADLQPSFVQNATLGGVQQAMPLIASTRTLFYNTDLFAKAGIAAPPKTWAELQTAAEKIQALGLPDTYGYGMPLGSEEAQAETSIWTFGAGGSWGDANSLTIDTPQNLEGLQAMRQLIDTKATQPDPGATDRTPLINVFIQGKLGMVEGLPPTVGQIAEKNPGLPYATAPIPTKDGTAVTLGVADHLMAFRNPGEKAEAIKKFVDYFYSRDVYVGWVEAEGFLPVTKSGAEALSSKTELKTFLEGLPTAKFYPAANAKWSATQGAMQSLVGQIGQGTDPAAVLQQVQTAADS